MNTLLGKGAVRRGPPAAPGHAGHARHRLRQQGGHRLRPDHGDRRALGRPHHRQAVSEFCADATKIHVDIDVAEFNKIVRPDVLARRRRAAGDRGPAAAGRASCDTAEWLKQIADWRKQFPLKYAKQRRPARAARARSAGRARRARLHHHHRRRPAPDVGGAVLPHHARTATGCRSGGAGTMGFGFPAAIGAQFACPDKKVWAIVGDGGFQMTMCELATAALHKLPVKILIINNSYLGMVRQWQELFFDNRLSRRRPRRQPRLREAGRRLRHQGLAHQARPPTSTACSRRRWTRTTAPASSRPR